MPEKVSNKKKGPEKILILNLSGLFGNRTIGINVHTSSNTNAIMRNLKCKFFLSKSSFSDDLRCIRIPRKIFLR